MRAMYCALSEYIQPHFMAERLNDLLAEQRRYLDVEAGYTSVQRRAWDAHIGLRSARGEIR